MSINFNGADQATVLDTAPDPDEASTTFDNIPITAVPLTATATLNGYVEQEVIITDLTVGSPRTIAMVAE